MRHRWPEGRKARGGSLIRGRRSIIALALLGGSAAALLLIPAQGEIQESGPPAGAPALRAGHGGGGDAERRGADAARGNDGASPPITLPCRYEIAAIIQGPFCNGSNAPVFARGLSNHDPPWVVGFYTQCTIGPEKAFVWTGSGPSGGLQTLQFPGVDYSFGLGLNDHGKVVGQYLPNVGGARGFIYDVATGTYITLEPIVPEGGSGVWDINNAGVAVGNRTISQTASNAFIWHKGVYTDLGVMNGPQSSATAISENGIVVGWTGSAIHTNDARGFVYQKGMTTIIGPLPNGVASTALGVNESAVVVGIGTFLTQTGAKRNRAFIWKTGAMIDLGVLPGYRHSGARGIDAEGRVVIGGCSILENGIPAAQACVWRDGMIVNLNQLLSPNAPVHLTDCYAINQRGQILCEGSNQVGKVAIVLSPMPAPLGDIDLDCIVNFNDLLLVIQDWGMTKSPADVNGDGIVNVNDLLIVINNWTF